MSTKVQPSLLPLRPQSFGSFLSTGNADLDVFLGGGWVQGGISQIIGRLGSGKTSLALQSAAKLTQEKKWVAWIGKQHALFPPAASFLGVQLSSLLYIMPESNERCLWAAREILQSSLFPLLILQDVFYQDREARRLQLAAEKTGSTVLSLHESIPQTHKWSVTFGCIIKRKSKSVLLLEVFHHRKFLLQKQIEVTLYAEPNSCSLSPTPPRVRLAS